MARPLRLEYEGAIYHVTVRGNGRRRIFLSDADRKCLLKHLAQGVEQLGVRLYLFCQMTNHFHLLIETPRANLSRFMHHVLTGFTIGFNRAHRRSGHVTDGRYKARLVEGDRYLLNLSRYVHLNPVKTKKAKSLSVEKKREVLYNHTWSTYRSYIGLGKPYPFVDYGPLLSLVGGRGKAKQQLNYAEFVEQMLADDDESFEEELHRSVYCIGSRKFREWVESSYRDLVEGSRRPEDASFRRVAAAALSPDQVLSVLLKHLRAERDALARRSRDCTLRAVAALMLCEYADTTQRQVAEVLGLATGAAVSYQIARARERLGNDELLRTRLTKARKALARLRPDD